jgi:hypothetical protein
MEHKSCPRYRAAFICQHENPASANVQILQALEQDEQETQEKLQHQQGKKRRLKKW